MKANERRKRPGNSNQDDFGPLAGRLFDDYSPSFSMPYSQSHPPACTIQNTAFSRPVAITSLTRRVEGPSQRPTRSVAAVEHPLCGVNLWTSSSARHGKQVAFKGIQAADGRPSDAFVLLLLHFHVASYSLRSCSSVETGRPSTWSRRRPVTITCEFSSAIGSQSKGRNVTVGDFR
jgi:hypothetical protein